MKNETYDEHVIVRVALIRVIFATIILAGLLYSCSPTLYVPASTDAAKQQQLLEGRKLYVDHCSGCHNLHFPKEYNAEGWKSQLEEMKVRAKITDAEKQSIFQFLTSHR